jgi:ADP-heptose:LPS heptosyltransferase
MQKILISKRRGIGDAVLMTPAIETLHRNYPEAEITVLTSAVVAPLFEAFPGVKHIWTFEENKFFSLAQRIAKERFDLFLDLNSSGSSRWLTRLSRAKQSLSHRHDEATAKRYTPRPNAIDWDIHALRDLFPELMIAPRDFLRPKIYFWEEEVKHAEDFWRSRGVQNGNVVVLGIGASRQTKRWPSEHYARFVALLRKRLHMAIAIFPGPDPEERIFANRLIQDINSLRLPSSDSEIIIEKVSNLRSLAALLATAHSYVGNDSGPKHIAVASGTPTLTFFGPEDPLEWHPYATEDHPILFQPQLSCRKEDGGRWCSIPECLIEKHRCMTGLSPESAFQAFLSLHRAPMVHDRFVLKHPSP